MRNRALLLCALVLVGTFAGCVRPPADSATTGAASEPGPKDESQSPVLERPNWTVGQWWRIRMRADFGQGLRFDFEGKLVVAKAGPDGYTVTSDHEGINVVDQYFPSFFVGNFDRDLNPRVGSEPVALYRWPLGPGESWSARLPGQGFRAFDDVADDVRVNVTEFEDDGSPHRPRLRIQGLTAHGEHIDYDLSAHTGWMTYFRLRNTTTGRIVLAVDVMDAGEAHQGVVNILSSEFLYGRFAMFPPFGGAVLFLDPANSMVPPTATLEVPAGFAFVDELQALFYFPAGEIVGEPSVPGAAEIAVSVTRPDGTVDENLHHGTGDAPTGKFERITVRERTQGTWSVSVATAGTGGCFVGIFGFREEAVVL